MNGDPTKRSNFMPFNNNTVDSWLHDSIRSHWSQPIVRIVSGNIFNVTTSLSTIVVEIGEHWGLATYWLMARFEVQRRPGFSVCLVCVQSTFNLCLVVVLFASTKSSANVCWALDLCLLCVHAVSTQSEVGVHLILCPLSVHAAFTLRLLWFYRKWATLNAACTRFELSSLNWRHEFTLVVW